MKANPSPELVAARLAELRALFVPMNAEEARQRLAATPRRETFAAGVERRLEELRALSELTTQLHQARRV
jgi:hypothetical protein